MTSKKWIVLTGCLLLVSPSAWGAGIFTPHLQVSEEYTDNRDQTEAYEEEEYSTIISPGFDYSLEGRRGSLDLSYTAGYVTYQESDENDTWRHNAALNFTAEPSRHTRLSFGDRYVRSDKPAQEVVGNIKLYKEDTTVSYDEFIQSIGDGTRTPDMVLALTRRGRAEYESNSANLAVTREIGDQNSLTFRYRHTLFNELEISDGNDNQQHKPSAMLTYWMTPQLGFDLSGSYTRADYRNNDDYDQYGGKMSLRRKMTKHFETYFSYRHTLFRNAEDTSSSSGRGDYDLYEPSVGVSYLVDENTFVSLGGGYFVQNMKENSDKDEEGLFTDASVRKVWKYRRWSFGANGSAGLDRNDAGTENLGLTRFYGLGGNMQYSLTRRLSFNTHANYIHSDYLDDDREDDFGRVGCGFTYVVTKWFDVNATFAHKTQQSTVDTEEYDENTAMLSVSFRPKGYRF